MLVALIVSFAVTVAIWPREVVSCHDFISGAVPTFWAMSLALDRWLVMGAGCSREVVMHRSLTYKLFGKLPAHLFP